jgi:hypothetical protein
MSNNFENAILVVLAFAHWCVLAGGIVVCLTHRYLSRWVWLILAGLTGLVGTGVLQRIVITFLNQSGTRYAGLPLIFPVTSAVNLGAWIMIVAGLALTLRDVTERLRILHFQLHHVSQPGQPSGN